MNFYWQNKVSAGRALGAAAAYTVGKLTGDEFLAAEGATGLRETGTALAISVGAAVTPYVSAAVIKGIRTAVTAADTALEIWKLPQIQRGLIIEQLLGKNIPHAFAVIDRWKVG